MKLESYTDLTYLPYVSKDELLNWLENPVNEGKIGKLLGGLAGLALGRKVGELITKALGIPQGSLLHELLTSRIIASRIGYALGTRHK